MNKFTLVHFVIPSVSFVVINKKRDTENSIPYYHSY